MLVEVSFAKTVKERRNVVIIVSKFIRCAPHTYSITKRVLMHRNTWMRLPAPLVFSLSGSTPSHGTPAGSRPTLIFSVHQTRFFGSSRLVMRNLIFKEVYNFL